MGKRTEIDFGDEDAVLAEMAKELDIDPDDLTIKEENHFGVTVYEISIGRGGSKEWRVVESEDAAHELAIEMVKQDLEQEPGMFNSSFIESHIDMDRLRRDLESDVLEERITYWEESDADDFWKEYERAGFDAPEEDEDGEREEPSSVEIEELAEVQTKEQLRDPMQYLEDIFTKEDAVKKAIEIAGIDINAAAEDAVDTDGAAHFLSSYDGNSYTTPSGLVYWRTN